MCFFSGERGAVSGWVTVGVGRPSCAPAQDVSRRLAEGVALVCCVVCLEGISCEGGGKSYGGDNGMNERNLTKRER